MAFAVLAPTDDHLHLFRDELWKERRLLQVVDGPGGTQLLRKHFEDRSEVESELRYMSVLREHDSNWVPAVLADAEAHVDLQYVEGMRVYNLLEMLKTIEAMDESAGEARRRLLDRCVASCKRVQRALVGHARSRDRRCYPLRRKLITLLSLFDHCLGLELDLGDLDSELKWAEAHLDRLSCAVPFRDAAPKNFILAWPEVWRGCATPGQQQELVRDAAAQWIRIGSSALAEAPIVNIDFSSCGELTVPEDDPISLLLHEASWLGDLPGAKQLLWQEIEPDPARLAIGIAVRMYRLGGRRLSYRLVHANGYRARYDHESIGFYFTCLLSASDSICTELRSRFPALLSATRGILSRLDEGLFTEVDWFDMKYSPQLSRYYRDVYPY